MQIQASTLKGTRDYHPEQVVRRRYIFDTIRGVFELYGFRPLETPAMEKLETLTGKYGDEGDRLIFKVLNNGDFLAKVPDEILQQRDYRAMIPWIARRALRYDLTVPFARYVVQHRHQLQFPFKRYQIQPVWRADRPQKGRYQEFYQCDADVVGPISAASEAELIEIYAEVFRQLQLDVRIRINNRKVLEGIAEIAQVQDRWQEMTIAIDKLDKIGTEGVRHELFSKGFTSQQIETIFDLLLTEDIHILAEKLKVSAIGSQGVEELLALLPYFDEQRLPPNAVFDFTLARGLNYYTGFIVEVVPTEVQLGSIGGGGRYDDLTGVFGLPNLPGVGISFGAERIYDALETLDRFPSHLQWDISVLLLSMDAVSLQHAFHLARQLRRHHIPVDIYPQVAKFKKQMKYANQRKVPYVLIIGEDERIQKCYTLKNMATGEQQSLALDELIDFFNTHS